MSGSYLDPIVRDIHGALYVHMPLPVEKLPLYRLYAVLLLVKGEGVTCEDVYHAWAFWESVARPSFHALEPFNALRPEIQQLSERYARAIRLVAAARTFQQQRGENENLDR